MTRSPGIVIVGAGQGGFQVAASLRDHGYDGSIVIIGDEPQRPYQRPPLSKAYLLGESSIDRLFLRSPDFYASQSIELIVGQRVAAIERHTQRVVLSDGAWLPYAHLVLATGARNRPLRVPGAELDGVLYLRTVAEADAVRERLAVSQDVLIVGAGFIGLELAAVASKAGKNVTVVEALSRCMSRAVTPVVSDHYAEAQTGWGVTLVFNVGVKELDGLDGHVAGVVLADGRRLPADLVLVGVGILPEVDLSAAAGLPADDGILTNAQLVTHDPNISAIGDCVRFATRDGWRLRLESVQNAVDQARCVARRLVGRPANYVAVPWFWSDQRDRKLQIVGLTAGHDRTVVRGNPAERSFSIFCFRGGRLLGIESVNRPADHVFGRKLLAAGANITADQAGDLAFDLKQVLHRRR
jgi:3-phenylpropionate/trans-cinnamate dioxygenase ferredoxin reductase component